MAKLNREAKRCFLAHTRGFANERSFNRRKFHKNLIISEAYLTASQSYPAIYCLRLLPGTQNVTIRFNTLIEDQDSGTQWPRVSYSLAQWLIKLLKPPKIAFDFESYEYQTHDEIRKLFRSLHGKISLSLRTDSDHSRHGFVHLIREFGFWVNDLSCNADFLLDSRDILPTMTLDCLFVMRLTKTEHFAAILRHQVNKLECELYFDPLSVFSQTTYLRPTTDFDSLDDLKSPRVRSESVKSVKLKFRSLGAEKSISLANYVRKLCPNLKTLGLEIDMNGGYGVVLDRDGVIRLTTRFYASLKAIQQSLQPTCNKLTINAQLNFEFSETKADDVFNWSVVLKEEELFANSTIHDNGDDKMADISMDIKISEAVDSSSLKLDVKMRYRMDYQTTTRTPWTRNEHAPYR